MQTLTAKESLRYLIDRQLGLARNPPRTRRLEEALLARRCRNVIFGAMAPVVYGATVPDLVVTAQTEPFADPIIVTDVLNYSEPDARLILGIFTDNIASLMRVFVTGTSAPEDLFAAGNFTPSCWTLGHYRNVSEAFATPWEAPSLKAHFSPYMLRPGSILRAEWELLDYPVNGTPQYHGELHCRGIRVLRPDDPYGQICGKLRGQVCDYIDRFDPETAIITIRIPESDFPAAGQSRRYHTPAQERPLLVLGMASNIGGAQVQMRDDSTHTNFVTSMRPPRMALNGGVEVVGTYPNNIVGIALYVLAANSDMTQHEAYNMFPVPHLLAPNTQLDITLTNGLRPNGNAATFEQSMTTINNVGVTTGDGFISLLCRTV